MQFSLLIYFESWSQDPGRGREAKKSKTKVFNSILCCSLLKHNFKWMLLKIPAHFSINECLKFFAPEPKH